MKVHFSKLLSAVVYTGDKTIKVRELMTSPLPEVNPGDVLIVNEKTAKFLSREGKPFERVDLADYFSTATKNPMVEQISDDAVATIEALKQTNLELENQVKVLEDEKADFESRINDEIEDLKKENQELNDKLIEDNTPEVKKTTTRRKTTKAAGGNS